MQIQFLIDARYANCEKTFNEMHRIALNKLIDAGSSGNTRLYKAYRYISLVDYTPYDFSTQLAVPPKGLEFHGVLYTLVDE